jgi:hypothetical protein
MTPRKHNSASGCAPHDPLPGVLRCVAELARLHGDHDLLTGTQMNADAR